jgi:hypothetical protein
MSRSKPSPNRVAAKPKSSRELQELQNLYEESRALYNQSPLSKSIAAMFRAKHRMPLTKAVSMGLGSLTSRDQSRRIKQLTIFLAIIEQLELSSNITIKLYAQDPTFTKVDERFLESLGIAILRTPSPSTLGEAEKYIDEKTLVYSPFLTIQAYQSIFASCRIGMLVGDDFSALRLKWPKSTTENAEVEKILKRVLTNYQRRSISQSVKDEALFWGEEAKTFPMALYWRLQDRAHNGADFEYPSKLVQDGGFGRLEKTISARL